MACWALSLLPGQARWRPGELGEGECLLSFTQHLAFFLDFCFHAMSRIYGVTLQWSHSTWMGGWVEPRGQSNTLRSTTTSVDCWLPPMVMVPHGGDVPFVWFADSATPAIEFRRTTCQRMYGPA